MIKVAVLGARGKMGSVTAKMVENTADFQLVAALDVGDNIDQVFAETQPDVVVDFTHPSVVKTNIKTILAHNAHAVVGTTGLSETDRNELHNIAENQKKSVAICPNFAIGVILMMQAAQRISKYMDRVEIIEMHHDQKAEAPSGTAIKTADMIVAENPNINSKDLDETELIAGARGGSHERIPIHSVRLPGYIASEEILFGGLGQFLSIRHDTTSRESFMPGVEVAIKAVLDKTGLIYGLENLLT